VADQVFALKSACRKSLSYFSAPGRSRRCYPQAWWIKDLIHWLKAPTIGATAASSALRLQQRNHTAPRRTGMQTTECNTVIDWQNHSIFLYFQRPETLPKGTLI
jgi:hypothetical protein